MRRRSTERAEAPPPMAYFCTYFGCTPWYFRETWRSEEARALMHQVPE
jgi:hypothetical protein